MDDDFLGTQRSVIGVSLERMGIIYKVVTVNSQHNAVGSLTKKFACRNQNYFFILGDLLAGPQVSDILYHYIRQLITVAKTSTISRNYCRHS